jgi:hypothetical protein
MLRRYTWESQKKRLQHYRRRQPETSVLYQIVYHGHEELQHVWEPRFQHQYGCFRDEVIEDVPHRHTVFTFPKRLRVFFKYDRKLNTIPFRAAWRAPQGGP